MVLHHSPHWGRSLPQTVFLLAGLLAMTVSPPARATTYITVDGRADPVTVFPGETITVRWDLSKPGLGIVFRLMRDVTRTGKDDPSLPQTYSQGGITDGGADSDPEPGKVAWTFTLPPGMPAGRYIPRVEENLAANQIYSGPVWIVAPKAQGQSINGRVTRLADGSPPPDAVIFAGQDPQTPLISAIFQPDGSYSMPVPPGTYTVFAEWFGSLRSQRRTVTVAAGQSVNNVDLPLLVGQEVSGRLTEGDMPLADTAVQAVSADGQTYSTQTSTDGSYVLVLPPGEYRVAARGSEEQVRVSDGPLDGIDFGPAPAGTTPTVGAIVTIAGNGMGVFGGDGRPARSARLAAQGMSIDAAGNLYLSTGIPLHRVRKIDTQGIITTVAGSSLPVEVRGLSVPAGDGGFAGDGGPATAAKLWGNQHVAADRDGNFYISEVRNNRVRKVDSQGVITTFAGSGPIGLGNGGFGGDGGPATSALLNGPQGVAVDATGNLFIADGRNNRVRKVTTEGTISTFAGGGTQAMTEGANALEVTLSNPQTMAFDRDGNLYINAPGLNRIVKVTPAGIITTVVGTGVAGYSGDGGPATAAQINAGQSSLAVDSAGNLFFGDLFNFRVRKVSRDDGTISTVAGVGTPGFSGNGGPATAAQLSGPQGLVIDGQGNVIFHDNLRIRKVVGIAAPGLVAGQ